MPEYISEGGAWREKGKEPEKPLAPDISIPAAPKATEVKEPVTKPKPKGKKSKKGR